MTFALNFEFTGHQVRIPAFPFFPREGMRVEIYYRGAEVPAVHEIEKCVGQYYVFPIAPLVSRIVVSPHGGTVGEPKKPPACSGHGDVQCVPHLRVNGVRYVVDKNASDSSPILLNTESFFPHQCAEGDSATFAATWRRLEDLRKAGLLSEQQFRRLAVETLAGVRG